MLGVIGSALWVGRGCGAFNYDESTEYCSRGSGTSSWNGITTLTICTHGELTVIALHREKQGASVARFVFLDSRT